MKSCGAFWAAAWRLTSFQIDFCCASDSVSVSLVALADRFDMWLAAVAAETPDNSSTAATAADAGFFIDSLLEKLSQDVSNRLGAPLFAQIGAGAHPGRHDLARPARQRRDAVVSEPAYKRLRICYDLAAPKSFNRAPREIVMAKGQMRSNKEKKKPKADKNLKKGGAAPVNPFAAGKTAGGPKPEQQEVMP